MDRELLKIHEITPLNLPGDINNVLLMRFKQQKNSSVGFLHGLLPMHLQKM